MHFSFSRGCVQFPIGGAVWIANYVAVANIIKIDFLHNKWIVFSKSRRKIYNFSAPFCKQFYICFADVFSCAKQRKIKMAIKQIFFVKQLHNMFGFPNFLCFANRPSAYKQIVVVFNQTLLNKNLQSVAPNQTS